MSSFTVFILCHNRPDDARRAIDSVLRQNDSDFELIVSDNSSDESVSSMLAEHFPQVRCVRRSPVLPALEHMNRCVDEAQGDLFCLFHDDDLMSPDFVGQMRQLANQWPDAVAIGCNAHIESHGVLEEQPSFRSRRQIDTIAGPDDLAARYFSRSQNGIAPFPGYVYNRHRVGSTRLRTNGGKYADVSWLIELCRKGRLVWTREPLMTYRIHGSNDGGIESRRDRLRFLGFMKAPPLPLEPEVIRDYRCSFIYKPLQKSSRPDQPWRRAIANGFLKTYHWHRYIHWRTYRFILARLFIRSLQ